MIRSALREAALQRRHIGCLAVVAVIQIAAYSL
jgi:hypothetical protein